MNATAIIAAVDEAATLRGVLSECRRAGIPRAIVVANGPAEGVAKVAEQAGATVLRYPERLGHDVGRALGAARTSGENLLFLDADLKVQARDLLPFLIALAKGVDVALNRIDPYIPSSARLHPVNSAKRFLNCALGRPDLGCASLTAVPHALSRRALEALGPAVLAVPPRAQATAVRAGLVVEAVHPVDVVRSNARRPGLNLGKTSPVEQLILGDHLEAIQWLLMETRSPRGGFSDLGRRRELLPR